MTFRHDEPVYRVQRAENIRVGMTFCPGIDGGGGIPIRYADDRSIVRETSRYWVDNTNTYYRKSDSRRAGNRGVPLQMFILISGRST